MRARTLHRVLGTTAAIVGSTVVFAGAAVTGAVVHLGLPTVRRFAAAQVNSILADSFAGKIDVQRVGGLTINGVEHVDATITDPEGNPVVVVRDASVRASTFSLVRSLVVGSGPLRVTLPKIRVGYVELVLAQNDKGDLSVARAFGPKDPNAPETQGRGVKIDAPDIVVTSLWAHGGLQAIPAIDAGITALSAKLAIDPKTTGITVKSAAIQTRQLGGREPVGFLSASASLPADANKKPDVSATFVGTVGQVPVALDASMLDEMVNATVIVPETDPAAINALAPGMIALTEPASVRVEAHGKLTALTPDVDVRVGGGEIAVGGLVDVGDANPKGSLDVQVKNFDAHAAQATAPKTKVSATVKVAAEQTAPGKVKGRYDLALAPSTAAGQVVPATTMRGDFTEASATGDGHVSEAGAPTDVHVAYKNNGVTFKTDTVVPYIGKVERAKLAAQGSAHVTTEGSVDLTSKSVDAKVEAEVHNFAGSGVALANAHVEATAKGSLTNPGIRALVAGNNLQAGGYAFDKVRFDVVGTTQKINTIATLQGAENNPSIHAQAQIDTSGRIAVRDVALSLKRNGVEAIARVSELKTGGGSIEANGVSIVGLGDPIGASFAMRGKHLTVKAKGERVELDKLAKLLGREEEVKGDLAFDVDVDANDRTGKGHVDVAVAHAIVPGLADPIDADLHAKLDGRELTADAGVTIPKVVAVKVNGAKVELDGAFADAKTWEKAKASAEIEASADLQETIKRVPRELRPVQWASGSVNVKANVVRDPALPMPSFDMVASAENVAVSGKDTTRPEGTPVPIGEEPWHVEGLGGRVEAHVDAKNGKTKVNLKLTDKHGALAGLDATTTLPLAELIAQGGAAMESLSKVPLDLHFEMPKRKLAELPIPGAPPSAEGEVSASLDVKGTADAPKVEVEAKGDGIRWSGGARNVPKLDLALRGDFEGKRAELHFEADRDGRRVMDSATVAIVDLASKNWRASSNVAFAGFPLQVVDAISPRGFKGSLDGSIALRDLHHDASLVADLGLRDLKLDKTVMPTAKVRVAIQGGGLNAVARLEQKDGYAEGSATGSMKWGAAIAPSLDNGKGLDGFLSAKNFRINAAEPLVTGTLDELDGRLDANLEVHAEAGLEKGKASGALTLRQGRIEAPAIGAAFHDVGAKVDINPWGTVALEDFHASGTTGTITGKATAKLHGFALERADASFHIPEKQALSLSAAGVPLGRASGDIKMTAAMSADQKNLTATVDVPKLHVELPSSTGHSVQDLDADKHVNIGVRRPSGSFAIVALGPPEPPPRPGDSTRIHAKIKLGEVRVRRDTSLDVTVAGSPTIEVGDKTVLGGSIRLVRGQIDVNGKTFKVDKGYVSFEGQAQDDPTVVASAYWDAPDGTRVFADFTGPVQHGKLTLRAEPARSQDEIVNLILFGQADGGFGASPPPGQQESETAEGAGLAGGVVTQALNKALQGIPGHVQTKVDTSESDNPRPELGLQLSERVTATLSYNLGLPPPGENPDKSQLTLDFRLFRRWSFDTTVGDHGSTSLDLLWRKRY